MSYTFLKGVPRLSLLDVYSLFKNCLIYFRGTDANIRQFYSCECKKCRQYIVVYNFLYILAKA